MNKSLSSIQSGYRRLLLCGLVLTMVMPWNLVAHAQPSQQTSLQVVVEDLGYEKSQPCLVRTNKDTYVRLKKEDYERMEQQAFLGISLLQRIRDLERLYRQIKEIIETTSAVVDFVKEFLNIDDFDIFDGITGSDNQFEHISGVVMSPGFVEFVVTTTDDSLNFDDIVNSNFLEFDLYYNKNLFAIDHIEGKGIFGDEYNTIALSQQTSGAKDRIKLPLSDLLTNQVVFRVYLAPLDHETIEVGDKTALDIRYYKRVPLNDDGERIAPLQYSFTEESATEIVVSVV